MPFLKGNKLGVGNKYNIGRKPWNKGTKGLMKAWNKGKKTGLVPKTAWKKGQKAVGTPFKKGHIMTPEVRQKIGNFFRGRKLSEEFKEKLRERNLGSKSHFWGKEGYWKGKHRFNMMGNKHPMWKGGKTKELDKLRTSLEYKLWRESVFKRDNYTCTNCNKKGGDLEAHHIFPFADYPELRFAINNGITLCIPCHSKLDKHRKLKYN